MAIAWCEFVLSLGGTPAASSTSGRAGISFPSTITVHFGIWRVHWKLRAALMMFCRVRAATLGLAILRLPSSGDLFIVFVHKLLLQSSDVKPQCRPDTQLWKRYKASAPYASGDLVEGRMPELYRPLYLVSFVNSLRNSRHNCPEHSRMRVPHGVRGVACMTGVGTAAALGIALQPLEKSSLKFRSRLTAIRPHRASASV